MIGTDDLDGAFAAVLLQQLQMHEKAAHNHTQEPDMPVHKKLNIEPPRISVGTNAEEWISFGRQWEMYKAGALIP